MGYWYHPEIEEQTVGTVMKYDYHRPEAKYCLVFNDGREYICSLVTYYESENGGELDIDEDDPRYDEFYEIAFRAIEVIRAGDSDLQVGQLFPVNYSSFPARITDVDTGAVIYPAPGVRSEDK